MRFRWPAILILAVLWLGAALALRQCGNSPWPRGEAATATYFTSFSTQIKSLDPSTANFTHESAVIDNIVEAPVAYHYLHRPYRLVPQLLAELPAPQYFDREGRPLQGDPPADQVARTEYRLRLKPGIRFQPHPCFNPDARPLVRHPAVPADFGPAATRELTAEDLKTALVRLCDPRVASTMYSTFAGFLAGMRECAETIREATAAEVARRLAAGESAADLEAAPSLPDYRKIPLAACRIEDPRTLVLVLTRKYPQALYWLAMHYFAPIPFEALQFYRRPDVRAAGLSWANWPVGTGPYMLEEADFNRRIVLVRNPNFHEMRYPAEGAPGDREAGLLEDAGKTLPLTPRVVMNYERETIPNWIKFQQGYYDNSGIPTDMFDNAVAMTPGSGELKLSPEMERLGTRLTSTVPPITYYFAFNLLDPVVGGLAPERRKLRQALAIALDPQEYIALFRNGNGIAAESIIPPGLFGGSIPPGHFNTRLGLWDAAANSVRRRPISEARRLLAEAGYPGGVDPRTGEPLVIHLDHAAAGSPDFKNRFRWLASRFRLLGVELEERPTDLNRNREKLKLGNWQMLAERGWVADYPDPENFLFLFHSANAHVATGGKGPNYTNYANPNFDRLFRQLETMPDSPERLALIRQAHAILAEDCPEIWLMHPVNTILTHRWLHNYKPSGIAYDTIQYLRVDPKARADAQRDWNRPRTWPVWLALALLTIVALKPRKHTDTPTHRNDGMPK